jgi:predicted metal-dependent HD superfamily phosphohydrolase
MNADREALEADWTALLTALGADARSAVAVFDTLARAYNSPHRHYHTLDHIAAVLADLHRVEETLPSPEPVLLAGWLHDLVYDSKAGDNEERSAREAHVLLARLGVAEAVVHETARLILLTRTHEAEDADRGGCALLDADLAILAAPSAEYEAYAAAIRREYAWVPEDRYREGRAQVLERFLQRERIYRTGASAGREEQARANLRRETAALRGQ